jgi:hypothetical protein
MIDWAIAVEVGFVSAEVEDGCSTEGGLSRRCDLDLVSIGCDG